MMRILIADDHAPVRQRLAQITASAEEMVVVAEASNGDEALAMVDEHEIDVALIDASMPGPRLLDLIARLRQRRETLRVLVISMSSEGVYATHAKAAGAAGFLAKDRAAAELVSTIRRIGTGF